MCMSSYWIKKDLPQLSTCCFMHIFRINVHHGAFIQIFFYAISQYSHKSRWISTTTKSYSRGLCSMSSVSLVFAFVCSFQNVPELPEPTEHFNTDLARDLAALHQLCVTHLNELRILSNERGTQQVTLKLDIFHADSQFLCLMLCFSHSTSWKNC